MNYIMNQKKLINKHLNESFIISNILLYSKMGDLLKKYAHLFKGNPEQSFELSVSSGWKYLIEDFFKQTDSCYRDNVRITLMKEKYGCLRIQYDFEGTEENEESYKNFINQMENLSSMTCYFCGILPCKIVEIGGWHLPHCGCKK